MFGGTSLAAPSFVFFTRINEVLYFWTGQGTVYFRCTVLIDIRNYSYKPIPLQQDVIRGSIYLYGILAGLMADCVTK